MLEIEARDGAGRIATWTPETGAPVETPGILWLDEELAPEEASWSPQVSRDAGSGARIVNTWSIQDDPGVTDTGGGSLLLRRRLEVPAAMQAGPIELRQVGPLRVLPNALDLWRQPERFAREFTAAREAAGYHTLLYAPGVAQPSNLALLVWAGVDLFDSVEASMAAARGRFASTDGSFAASDLVEAECACPACAGDSPASLGPIELRRHNQWALRLELAKVRSALRAGRLRELVESRCRAHPELAARLRQLDNRREFFDQRLPTDSSQNILATTAESLTRPDVARFRHRVATRYRSPEHARILVLLPCSARKPYGTSQSHRWFQDALWRSGAMGLVEEWIVTSPLGVVPRALERTYPAAHYDVPVTGRWDAEEGRMIRGVVESMLARSSFDHVIAHLPESTYSLVREVLPETTVHTVVRGGAASKENAARLEAAVRNAAQAHDRVALPKMLKGRLAGLASYQLPAEAAEALVAGADAKGKWPGGKLLDGATQLASFPLGRGFLSLTLDGAKRIQDVPEVQVEIEDFAVKGSVFAAGVVKANPAIRRGDEVVVVHDGELRGVGVAKMDGVEMTDLPRGEAVKVRHHG